MSIGLYQRASIRKKKTQDYNYEFMSTFRERHEDPEQRWTTGESPDGKGEFSFGYQPGNDHPDLDEMIDEMYNATS